MAREKRYHHNVIIIEPHGKLVCFVLNLNEPPLNFHLTVESFSVRLSLSSWTGFLPQRELSVASCPCL